MDTLSPEQRSLRMAAIRQKHTSPELAVRRLIRSLGVRYRLHPGDLPGHPDIVVRKLRKAIFVHGCFWHQHPGCRAARLPATHPEYWGPKLEANVRRDSLNEQALIAIGWQALVVWQCELRNEGAVRLKLSTFLEFADRPPGI